MAKTSMAAAFKKRLKAANKSWKSAKEKAAEAGPGFSDIDDGKYVARLMGGKIGESEGGRLQIDFTFKIQEGKHEGKTKHDYQGLETEQNLEFLGRRLTQLGYELPDDLEEIEDILEDIGKSKPLCKIRLKTKGDFQNVYIDRVFNEDEEAEEDSDDETEEDTDAEETDEVEEEAEEEEPAPAKKSKAKAKAKAAKPAKVEEPEEEETDDEEADDEEVEEEAEEEETEDEETVELTKGMSVIATTTKGDQKGTVLEVIESEGKARVKLEDGRTIRIDVDKLAMADDVPEEPAAKPKRSKK